MLCHTWIEILGDPKLQLFSFKTVVESIWEEFDERNPIQSTHSMPVPISSDASLWESKGGELASSSLGENGGEMEGLRSLGPTCSCEGFRFM